ncbi:hypothetical protein [Alloprevotella sp. oral taxon 473]|uniref:hypothetical protein n=1 Tax=Alloprevotella sp. oral taxon 473 TaxID=712469 RepID=UPI0002A202E3|nr:hypothetical protein [Alloprevotella sp. oral taxon 473]EKX91111.1 hypothetical protein HMPREF9999_01145 [Alloprevotella sp. oral taxon 473 str. F0040]
MTYEEEQIKYAKELKDITDAIRLLEKLFKDSNQANARIWEHYTQLNPTDARLSFSFEIQEKVMTRQLLEGDYRKKVARKKELERLLSQTPSERTKENLYVNIGKAVKYMASITPQHVSGRVYKVENGDGCGMFCLWFIVIDVIIGFLWYIISGGN